MENAISCYTPVSLPPTLNRSRELQELYGSVPSLGTFTGNPTNDRDKGPVSFMWGEGGVVTLTQPCIITHHRYAAWGIITRLWSSQDIGGAVTRHGGRVLVAGGVAWPSQCGNETSERRREGGSGGGDRRLVRCLETETSVTVSQRWWIMGTWDNIRHSAGFNKWNIVIELCIIKWFWSET